MDYELRYSLFYRNILFLIGLNLTGLGFNAKFDWFDRGTATIRITK